MHTHASTEALTQTDLIPFSKCCCSFNGYAQRRVVTGRTMKKVLRKIVVIIVLRIQDCLRMYVCMCCCIEDVW